MPASGAVGRDPRTLQKGPLWRNDNYDADFNDDDVYSDDNDDVDYNDGDDVLKVISCCDQNDKAVLGEFDIWWDQILAEANYDDDRFYEVDVDDDVDGGGDDDTDDAPVLGEFDIRWEEVVSVAISLQRLPPPVHVHAEPLLHWLVMKLLVMVMVMV